MIGAGSRSRSKGCITCRRRKVKCDEARPTCNRCKNGFFFCLGYTRPTVFIDEGTTLQRPPVQAMTVSHSQSLNPGGSNSNLDVDVETLPIARSYPTPENIPLNQSLHLNAFKENILVSYLLKNLFVKFVDPRFSSDYEPWLLYALQRTDPDSTSYNATLALGAAFFGRIHKEKKLCEQGSRSYGRALRQLKLDLGDPEQVVTYFTVISMLLLSIYEIVAFSNVSGWLEHFNGIGIVTELAGPYAYQTRPASDVFLMNRTLIALNSLVRRKHCFLEQDIWKTIPWALEPNTKTLGMYIQDILCDVPGFLEDSQKIQDLLSSSEDVTDLQKSLRQQVNVSLDKLYDIRWRWEHEFPRACYENPLSSISETLCVDAEGALLFPSTFHFWSIERANEIGLYDAILLLLFNLLESLDLLSGHSPSERRENNCSIPLCLPTNPLLLPGQGTRTDIALEICRLVDYFLLSKQHNTGALLLMFPLRMAYRAFNCNSREAAWLNGIMLRIADINGFEMSRHVLRDLPTQQ